MPAAPRASCPEDENAIGTIGLPAERNFIAGCLKFILIKKAPYAIKDNLAICKEQLAFKSTVKGAKSLKEIQVKVVDNDLEKAMRILKKKIQNDGLFKRLKLKKSYEKPSEFKRRKQREALRRQRIAAARSQRYRYR